MHNLTTDSVVVRPFTKADEAAWDAFCLGDARGTFCHLSGWKRAIERTWGHQPHYLIAERAGRITGILPLFEVKSLLFGHSLVSVPNGVYGGIVAADAASHTALESRAAALGQSLRVDYVELRDRRADDRAWNAPEDWHVKELYVGFEQPLTTDEDALMGGFKRELRRMIRQGVKAGLTSRVGREDHLDRFFDAYAFSLHGLGTPVFPKGLFANLLEEFPAHSDILVVEHDGRLAGTVFSFYHGGTVYPYYAGAYPQYYKAGVNNFLYWELMRHAAARGCTTFDFGRSKLGTGAHAFKRTWGMHEYPLPYRYHLVRAREMPNMSPTNARYSRRISLWKRLPPPVTKLLGPLIVKGLP